MAGWNRACYGMAVLVALAALFLLPAIRLSAPLLPARQWTIASLAADTLHLAGNTHGSSQGQTTSLRTMLQSARRLQQQMQSGPSPAAEHLDGPLLLAAGVPVSAVVAGLCALLSLPLWLLYRQGWAAANAATGAAACSYAIVASWWLTHALQAAERSGWASIQQHLSGLLNGISLGQLESVAGGPFGLFAGPGLYVVGLALLVILVLPRQVGS